MKILAFAASSSTKSINKQLATYAAKKLKSAHDFETEIEIIDLNKYELPLFSEDREAELGHPELAKAFLEKIAKCDVIIISFAEHNGSYSVAYKNIFDWASRINSKVFQGKSMMMLATSPGPGGAASVLASAVDSAPFFNGEVRASLSVPSFYDNFDIEKGQLSNKELDAQLIDTIKSLLENTAPAMTRAI